MIKLQNIFNNNSFILGNQTDGKTDIEWYAYNGSLNENIHNASFWFDNTIPTVSLVVGTPSNGSKVASWTSVSLHQILELAYKEHTTDSTMEPTGQIGLLSTIQTST